MKKILIALGLILVILIAALVAVPYLFKDEIISQIKKASNESLTATVDFKDVSLSIFRHFPKLSVGLEQLEISGSGPFEGVKLVQCERLDVSVDLWSILFGKNIAIKGLYFKKPDIRVFVLSDGRANYDIVKPSDTPAGATTERAAGSPIKLEKYAIYDGHILYDDRPLDMRAELEGLNHSGSGEFTADLFDLTMKTHIEGLSLQYGGMQYLRRAQTDWTTTLSADMKNMKFTLKDNDLKVNDLSLILNGWVQLPNDADVLMDLNFGTPANKFKSFLSIIPGAYTKDFDDVKANGTIKFAGFVKGKYNETTYPAFRIDMNVANGDFKYPSLPLGVSAIQVDASVNSPSARLNDMTVNIPKFGLNIGSNPLSGYFFLKTPESNPSIDTKIDGTLNLGELSKAFPMEGIQELSGIIRANIVAKASMNQLDAQQYDQVQMAGDFDMQNLIYRGAGMPAVKINSLSAGLSPQRLDLRRFDAKLGGSDLRASGSIDNVLAYFSTNKTMTGALNFQSTYFDANEWMGTETSSAGATSTAPAKTPTDVPAASEKAFDRWDFRMDGQIARLKYDTYDISNLAMKGHFTPNKMDIENFGLKMGQSDLQGDGRILNAWNYLFDNQTVMGAINLRSRYFDLNQFMTEPTTTGKPAPATQNTAAPAPEAVIPVPENMDMTLNADFGKIQYTTMTLENLQGQVLVKNSVATLNNVTANVIGGQIALNGAYNTVDLSKPSYNMDLALQNMGFKDAFQQFATVKAIAPIAQLIDGRFNTSLSMSGLLGKDMMPDFSTLSAAGFLETINAAISNFKGLTDIGAKLNLNYFNKLDLGSTKNWFEIKNGQVSVKPFNTKVRDVSMQIGGVHGIGGDMNYQIFTKTPRKALGTAANSGLNLLSKEASKYGVSLAQGEFINVRFDLSGKLANPKVAMKVLGSDGQSTIQEQAGAGAQAAFDQAKDSLQRVASQKIEETKAKAQEMAQKASDSLKNVANREAEKMKEKAAEEARKQAEKVLGQEAGKQVGEKVGDKGQQTVEEAKKKLETWDPFKKKKNN